MKDQNTNEKQASAKVIPPMIAWGVIAAEAIAVLILQIVLFI